MEFLIGEPKIILLEQMGILKIGLTQLFSHKMILKIMAI